MSATIIDHALKSSVRIVRVIIVRYRDDCPSSPPISSGRTGRAWAPWSPKKRPPFHWWNVQVHSIQRRCCILTTFMLVVKSTCDVFQILTCFYPGNIFICTGVTWTQTWFSILTYTRLSVCRIKPSAWFPYNLQKMTSGIYFIHPQNLMEIEWVHLIQLCI